MSFTDRMDRLDAVISEIEHADAQRGLDGPQLTALETRRDRLSRVFDQYRAHSDVLVSMEDYRRLQH